MSDLAPDLSARPSAHHLGVDRPRRLRPVRNEPATTAGLSHASAGGASTDSTAPLRLRLWAVPEIVRVGLEAMLADHGDRICVQAPGSGERPHVTIVDPLSPGADLVPTSDDVPIVALTWDSSPRAVHRARSLGAVRILPVSIGTAELLETVELVHRTATAEAGRTTSRPQAGDHWSPHGLLSGREAQIIERICRGMSNDEIAGELYLSINSVKTYIRTAYRKIGVTRRSQAVLWGVEHGL